MNWGYRTALYLYKRNLLRFLPWRFLRAYVYQITVRGAKKPYQAAHYFDSYYKSTGAEFSDRITIGPAVKALHSRFHYNCVENSIIRALLRCEVKERPAVFDLGSGAGHWIDFYLDAFGATAVCGLEVSKVCATMLRDKYARADSVSILDGDISDGAFRLDRNSTLLTRSESSSISSMTRFGCRR